jgi:protein-S-isoprenylcysteine O-methyltransferase
MDHAQIVPAFAHAGAVRFLFLGSYAAWLAVEIGIWSRDRRRVAGAREDRGSFFGIVIAITAAMFCAFAATRIGAARIPAPPPLLAGAGAVLIWLGIALRVWAVRTLGRYFRITVTIQDDHRLIDTGPYRHLSNPSYSGGLLSLAGVGLAIGNWISLSALILLPAIGFATRIRAEEASLAGRFGDAFVQYRRARWALVPFLW